MNDLVPMACESSKELRRRTTSERIQQEIEATEQRLSVLKHIRDKMNANPGVKEVVDAISLLGF